MKTLLLTLAALAVVGCSAGETSMDTGPGKGVIRRDIDNASSTAQTASARVLQANKDASDGQ